MFKLCFVGAGSTIFAKNVLGDCILTPELGDFEIALYDIDESRLDESFLLLNKINSEYKGKAVIKKYTNRKDAFRNSKFIINAMQVGGIGCTYIDFDIPKKYGLRQTIGDTMGVAGVFRGLRTIKVLEEMAEEIKEVCPDVLFLNYGNPMAILSGYINKYLGIKCVGLCHSVQYCVKGLLQTFKMEDKLEGHSSVIYGINHQAWLLDLKDKDGNDLYPIIKAKNNEPDGSQYDKKWDLVRLEILRTFGYYVTESSEHTSEYTPWFIKAAKPQLIEEYNIPLDEYIRRSEKQIKEWKEQKEQVLSNTKIEHKKSIEYACSIIKAVVLNQPVVIHGNVMNTEGLIPNLPLDACVEVPVVIDGQGFHPQKMPPLPEVCAAINRTNINTQILAMQGAYHRRKDEIIQACCLDPHTSSELSINEIRSLVNDMFEAEREFLPEYK